MPKLPVCPYCGSRFFYSQVKESLRAIKKDCPNCKKTFLVYYKKKAAIFLTMFFLLLIVLNVCLMNVPGVGLLTIGIVTALCVALSLLLIPYMVTYQTREEKNTKNS